MPESLPPTIWENHCLDWGRQTHVMGIINITPDSFSGDGLVENTLTQEEIVQQAVDLAQAAGIAWEHLIIDPGIGFGTTPQENLTLLRRLGELRALGRPILLGTSRKSTIGLVLGGLPAHERIEGTAATVALGIAQGADIVRVHDIHEMMRVVKMSDAIVRGTTFL